MHLRPTNLWHNSDFLKLWIGQTISEIGSRVTLVALPLVAVLVLNANPFQMGLLAGIGGLALLGVVIALGGVGNVIGAAIAPRLMRRAGIGAALIGSILIMGAASLMIPLAHGSVATATAFLMLAQVGDVCWPVINVCELSLRQAITPGEVLGRVNGAMQMLNRGLLPIGSLGAGILAEMIGLRPTGCRGSRLTPVESVACVIPNSDDARLSSPRESLDRGSDPRRLKRST